jgi:alkylation response protein AidB-like acyl-CoA dehydrogenase
VTVVGAGPQLEVAAGPDLEVRREIIATVRRFVDEQVLPQAGHWDATDQLPPEVIGQMKALGLLGLTIPERYGGLGLDFTTYAMIIEELARGWISVAGVVNTHLMGGYLLRTFGTEEQKQSLLPRMATGELRGCFSLSEPEVGSDVQSLRATARLREDGSWELHGQKMWVTSSLHSSVMFVLMRSDPDAQPRWAGITCFIVEKEAGASVNSGPFAGVSISPRIHKMGYRGLETSEVVFDGYRCPRERVLGGTGGLGQGFTQMMDALETGRINVAARGVGIGRRALELALRYSQERVAFGRPIAHHQAIQFKLADMATKVEAARLLTLRAAQLKDAGARCDLEAGMAKLFACEAGKEVVEDALRIHGGYGYSSEYEIERLYRDAPLLLVGEGTSDIQRMVIGRRLLERHPR